MGYLILLDSSIIVRVSGLRVDGELPVVLPEVPVRGVLELRVQTLPLLHHLQGRHGALAHVLDDPGGVEDAEESLAYPGAFGPEGLDQAVPHDGLEEDLAPPLLDAAGVGGRVQVREVED